MTRFDLSRLTFALVAAAALLAACGDGGSSTPASAESEEIESEETSTAQTDASGAEALPPEPQEVEFQAADGQPLLGIYYPASTAPAPVVVLIHWAGGDLSDWYEVAPWLQNRGLDNPYTNPGDAPWWDPSWFPSASEAVPVGVFIITLRDCAPSPTGCQGFEPQGWLLDAQAALAQAALLDGADPQRIAAIGSSIGADAAADACFWLNDQTPGSCDGALSLSPGSFLDVPYPTAVENLGGSDPAVPAWCLASPEEIAVCETADGASNTAFRAFEIAEGRHGNELMIPPADPSTMQTMLDFLALIFSD